MINIDTVYQKVLAIANKEQRGYITPQEFNLFADYAQKDIFEKYFYDISQFKRVPGNSSEYSDIINNLQEKISLFERFDQLVNVIGDNGDVNLVNDIPDLYRSLICSGKILNKKIYQRELKNKLLNLVDDLQKVLDKKKTLLRGSYYF